MWNDLLKQLQPRLNNPQTKEQYFDGYFHLAQAIYQHALRLKDPAQQKKFLKTAASYITKLEQSPDPTVEPTKKRFVELMEKEPLLKAEYDELKKNAN